MTSGFSDKSGLAGMVTGVRVSAAPFFVKRLFKSLQHFGQVTHTNILFMNLVLF